MPAEIDLNAMVEERIAFLKSAHPEVTYDLRLAPERPDRDRRSGSDQRRADESAGERRAKPRGRAGRRCWRRTRVGEDRS